MHPLTDTAIQHLSRLIAFPTVSGTPNVDALHHIAAHLASAGASVEVIEDGTTARGNLIAHFGHLRVGGLMLAGHIDVVPADAREWEADPFEAEVTADRIIARGAADMKGFLACVMALLGTGSAFGCPVTFVVTDDEERTFSGARHLIGQLESRKLRPRLNVVGEPTLCRVAIAHPGFSDWATTFTGTEGHSGEVDPEAGAIDAALRFMSRLRAAVKEAGDQAPRINFGQIAGGTARNIVPATCTLHWEARVASPAQSDWLAAWLAANSDHSEIN
jgi:acetylornithine deacetylase